MKKPEFKGWRIYDFKNVIRGGEKATGEDENFIKNPINIYSISATPFFQKMKLK